MEPMPFAGFNPKPSPWGYSWTTDSVSHEPTTTTTYRNSPTGRSNGPQHPPQANNYSPTPEPQPNNQYINMPAALLSSLKREKKPFTYTPGGVNLPELLNARLQKRIERKKKNSVGPMSPAPQDSNSMDSLPNFDPPKQVMVMPTYNSPLDMYSMENAIEALEVQAGLTVSDKSRSATLPRNHTFHFDDKDFDPGRNVHQSKAFKVLQIITDTEEEPPTNEKSNKYQYQDEMRFTGIRETKAIPSKFFHNLQRITGTEEDEEENSGPREMERMGAPKTTVYEAQPHRQQGFQPQQNQFPVHNYNQQNQFPVHNYNQQNHVTSFQPQNQVPIQQMNGPVLKRPAAFLPAKTFGVDPLSRVKPVQPAFLSNGPRRIFNPSAGTDF